MSTPNRSRLKLHVLPRPNGQPWRVPGRWPLDGQPPGPEPLPYWVGVDRSVWVSMRAFLRNHADLFEVPNGR